jgi:hypothetical protein
MKRFIPTVLLLLVCVGAFWYASSQNFFREKQVLPQTLITVKKEDVQAVSVQSADNQVELQRKDNGWSMTKPSALPLSSSLIESWIDSLGLVTQNKVVEENAADLAKYGLDKPAQVYKVTMKDGSTRLIQVGEPLPIQGYFYTKVEGSNAVYQVSEQTLTALNKAPIDFMDASPVKLDEDQVQSVKVTWKGQNWNLVKSDKDKAAAGANWKLGEKELKGTDATQLLDKLIFLSTKELAKPAAQVQQTAPELKVEISLSANGSDSAIIYQGKIDQDKVWVAKQGDEWAYAIPVADIQAIADQFVVLGK